MSQASSFPFAEPIVSIGKCMLSQRAFKITRFRRVAMISMERRVWPILDVRNMPMLNWVEPTIINVVIQITFVANNVFPITALPNATLAAHGAHCIEPLVLWKRA